MLYDVEEKQLVPPEVFFFYISLNNCLESKLPVAYGLFVY